MPTNDTRQDKRMTVISSREHIQNPRQDPQIHQWLHQEMMCYFKAVGARFPKPNPNYHPEVYQKDKKGQTAPPVGLLPRTATAGRR